MQKKKNLKIKKISLPNIYFSPDRRTQNFCQSPASLVN